MLTGKILTRKIGCSKAGGTPVMAMLICLFFAACSCAWAAELHHYVYFNVDRERISEPSFLDTKAFDGAQIKYTWKQLEPEKDKYDFAMIEKDLDYLKAHGKRLFIQLQDASFNPKRNNVPAYLTTDPRYHGGFDFEREDNAKVAEGTVSRRWDPAVQERYQKLLAALGQKFDGKIEGINLPETSIEFGESGKNFPRGFTPTVYRDAVISNMKALKKDFPTSVGIQYANFMPGGWDPPPDKSALVSVYRYAQQDHIGVGGPDLLPGKRSQMTHSYKLIHDLHGAVPVGIAVQDGNYSHINPDTKKRVTTAEQIDFAQKYLGAKYIFWCMEEPFYSRDLLPYMRASDHGSKGQ